MRSFTIVSFCFILLVAGTAAINPAKKNKQYVSNFENVLGTSLEIKINAASPSAAEVAENAALAEIERLNLMLSTYNASSEFKKWEQQPAGPVKVSAELFQVLSLFDSWSTQSSGALSAAAETIGKVWKNAALTQNIPSDATLQAAVEKAQAKHWTLDATQGTATRIDDAPLALNSFVKSYIINKAADAVMRARGISGVVVNIGGDIVVKGDTKEAIAISNPVADAENDMPLTTLKIGNKAIATSGNYRRGYKIGQKWYSHIVDPRTGKPVEEVISATVIADDASTAGALATAFNVLTVAESKALAAKIPGTEYLIIKKNGTEIKSKGWNALEEKTTAPKAAPVKVAKADKLWDTKYELAVNLELALIEGQRIHRPFVAIWVEGADKKPVRNLTIWYNKPKWLSDLKNWYRVYGLDFDAEGNPVKSTSSATRSPGKYTIKWDGKDDKGNLVKAGTYTINIEVAREHGTYQLLTQEMNFNGTTKLINLANNVEVASASLDYRKKSK